MQQPSVTIQRPPFIADLPMRYRISDASNETEAIRVSQRTALKSVQSARTVEPRFGALTDCSCRNSPEAGVVRTRSVMLLHGYSVWNRYPQTPYIEPSAVKEPLCCHTGLIPGPSLEAALRPLRLRSAGPLPLRSAGLLPLRSARDRYWPVQLTGTGGY